MNGALRPTPKLAWVYRNAKAATDHAKNYGI